MDLKRAIIVVAGSTAFIAFGSLGHAAGGGYSGRVLMPGGVAGSASMNAEPLEQLRGQAMQPMGQVDGESVAHDAMTASMIRMHGGMHGGWMAGMHESMAGEGIAHGQAMDACLAEHGDLSRM